jgi:hypothetical protein
VKKSCLVAFRDLLNFWISFKGNKMKTIWFDRVIDALSKREISQVLHASFIHSKMKIKCSSFRLSNACCSGVFQSWFPEYVL